MSDPFIEGAKSAETSDKTLSLNGQEITDVNSAGSSQNAHPVTS